MRYWTYLEIKNKVRIDLGLEQEEFITDTELMGYCNLAIDDCESDIHTMYEDYFLAKTTISLVAGQEEYSLPTDIYASKIRSAVYNDGSTVYPVRRYANMSRLFEAIETSKNLESQTTDFAYYLLNSSAVGGVMMNVVPTPKQDSADVIKLYYIRNANRLVDDTSLCDIPEFTDYIIQFVKTRCYEKEGHPNFTQSAQMVQYKKQNMINTLSTMTPDDDNEIEQDASIYWDMESGDGFNY